MADRQHVSSGCKGSVANDWADLACNLWPHDDDPAASHWDADARIWWQTEAQHIAHVAGQRAAIDHLKALACDMLSSFIKTSDGHRARVGQVQIARWRERLGVIHG
jgi:hypothetical protein